MLDRWLGPPRQRGVEYIDDPAVDARTFARSIQDITLANALFGGTRAVLRELEPVLDALAPRAMLLDVGSGAGDIAEAAGRFAAGRGVAVTTIGLDLAAAVETAPALRRATHTVRGDAVALPLGDASVDVVICSQLAHHFTGAGLRELLRELDRVARVCVIVSDLRRSRIAAAGFWVAAFPLGFHPISRHDGVVSVMRGFTTHELSEAVLDAVGVRATLRRHLGFRVTASWAPSHHAVRTSAERREPTSRSAFASTSVSSPQFQIPSPRSPFGGAA